MNTNLDSSISEMLEPFERAFRGTKAERIVVLDVRGLTSIADLFIICNGKSNRQVTAIADHIQTDLKKSNLQTLSVEGRQEGHWIILDYGDVVVHVFYEATRTFYDLEGLWIDARRVSIEAPREDETSEDDSEIKAEPKS